MNIKTQPSAIPDPAFPIVAVNRDETQIWPGLTKREYIALHLMQGIMSGPMNMTLDNIERAASDAVVAANALIRKLPT